MLKIEDLLAECLTAIDEGATLDECLARHPEWGDELEPLLRTALRMREAPTVVPSARFREDARDQMALLIRHRQTEKEAAATQSQRGWLDQQWSLRGIPRRVQRAALSGAAALALLLLVGLFTAGVVNASSASLPGESLYRVKLAGERVRLALATSPETEIRLRLSFASERLSEAQTLVGHENGEQMDHLMSRYAAELEAASGILRRQRDRDSGVAALSSNVEQIVAKQESALSEIRDRVPEEALPALERALAASQQAREAAQGPVDESPGPPEGIEGNTPDSAFEAREERTGTPPLRPTDTASPSPEPEETMPHSGPNGFESPEPPRGLDASAQPPGQTRTPGPSEPPSASASSGNPGRSGESEAAQPPGRTRAPEPRAQDEPPGSQAEEATESPGQARTPQPPGQNRSPGPPGQN